jgi:dihydroxyacetone kinase-like protein
VPLEVTVPSTIVSVSGWMRAAAAAIDAHAEHLTALDSAIGDGDHGVNMKRGMQAVLGAMEGAGDEPPGRLLVTAGKTLVSSVGGASGPLWGTALRRAGRAVGDATVLDGPALATALEAAVAGVVELGAAEPGDKTMVDALGPAVRALREGVDAGRPLGEVIDAAAGAAEAGARSTVPMQARKGRASYLGERSVGHEDPGAASTTLMIRALSAALEPSG